MAPKKLLKTINKKIIENTDDEEEQEEQEEQDQEEDEEEQDQDDDDEQDEENSSADNQSSLFETEDDQELGDIVAERTSSVSNLNSMIITGNDRISSSYMTSYELNRIISIRTNQLRLGAKPMLRNVPHNAPPEDIVLQELKNKTLPFILFRHTPHGNEQWELSELSIDHLIQ
jgi:DNA-directed RNA polymerase subunit K/omega